ncbi:MAG: hypothetical protein ABIQ88_17905 [Chitinophagaceae bacterium]
MKHTYITLQVRIACLSRPARRKNIHEQLEETIAERKIILRRLNNTLQLLSILNLLGEPEANNQQLLSTPDPLPRARANFQH